MLRDYWYPVARTADLEADRVLAVELFGEPLVLFRDEAGRAQTLADRCPHRSVPLSRGRAVNGRLSCAYHGWQFGTGGACLHIPTLDDGENIPTRANADARVTVEKNGLLWVWGASRETADPNLIPDYPERTSKDWWVALDDVREFEFDHGLLIENLIDPTHIPFLHPTMGTAPGTPPEPQPVDVKVHQSPSGEMEVDFRFTREPPMYRLPPRFLFDPPCHVRIENKQAAGSGLRMRRVFHCVPASRNRCRLIYWLALRIDALELETQLRLLIPRLKLRLEHRWLKGQTSILLEDVNVIMAQQERLRLGAPAFGCPVKSDAGAVLYRRWREDNEDADTWFAGYETMSKRTNGDGNTRALPILEEADSDH